jgi:hypothetical protein
VTGNPESFGREQPSWKSDRAAGKLTENFSWHCEGTMNSIANEVEWRECGEPDAMICYLLSLNRGIDRQWRLFACACARSVWDLLSPAGWEAIEASERAADGLPLSRSLEAIAYQVWPAPGKFTAEGKKAREEAAAAARMCCSSDARYGIRARQSAALAAGWLAAAELPRHAQVRPAWQLARRMAEDTLAGILRDIFDPFVPTVTFATRWLDQDHGFIRRMSQDIYHDRNFHDLPVLADALEDAGCDDPHLLEHLRRPDGHVRGCWALDVVLGKAPWPVVQPV